MTETSGGKSRKPTEDAPDPGDDPTTPGDQPSDKQEPRTKHERMEACFRELFKLYASADGNSSAVNDAVANVLTVTLGSAPSFAVSESMISASQAQGQMLTNAVANQQKTNLVGLTATTACVRSLLSMTPSHHRVYEEEIIEPAIPLTPPPPRHE